MTVRKDIADDFRQWVSLHPPAITIPPPEAGKCPVYALANEILCEIFGWVLLTFQDIHDDLHFHPYARRVMNNGSIVQPVLLSQVCRRWRNICCDATWLWTMVKIWHTNHSDVWRTILSRSKQRSLDVEIYLPDHHSIELWERPKIDHFKNLFKAIRACAPRMRKLKLHCPNTTLRIIINDAFERIHFNKLERLGVSQAGQQPLCFFGPMSFNREVFRTLNLHGVMVDCDAPCLAGVETLSLVGSSGTILDQEKLSHSTYPAIPPGPTLEKLQNLIVVGTYPVPIHHRLLKPSFNLSTLTLLHLSQIRVPIEGVAQSVARLFQILCHAPALENLVLEAFDYLAFRSFVEHVEQSAQKPQYPNVDRIQMSFIDTRPITAAFLLAFPALCRINFHGSDPGTTFGWLQTVPSLCPKLASVWLNGEPYSRDGRRLF